MPKLDIEIPDFLAKHGVKRVEDNVPDGHGVKAPARRFVSLFRKRLMAEFTTTVGGSNDEPGEKQDQEATVDPAEAEYQAFLEELAKSKRR